MTNTRLFFRADGNEKLGLGHIYRSLALAELLHHDFECIFITRTPAESLKALIANICNQVIYLPWEVESEKEAENLVGHTFTASDMVVLDGYHFDTAYQAILKPRVGKLVSIDDIHQYHFLSDAVINFAGGVPQAIYDTAAYTRLYLGLKYAMLRKPFMEAARCSRQPGRIENVFVCMGGADTGNVTVPVLKKLESYHTLKSVVVVTGSHFPFQSELTEFIKQSTLPLRHLSNLGASEIAAVMASCEAAICPPSTVSLEFLAIGGALFLVQTADNQADTYRYLLDEGLAADFEFFDPSFDPQTMVNKQKAAFDGLAGQRLREVFRQLNFELNVHIRRADARDLLTYFHWANDAEVRNNSINREQIPFEHHQNWFFGKINAAKTHLFFFEWGETPLGQVRFDEENGEAWINYSLDSRFRFKGLGALMLQSAIYHFQQSNSHEMVVAGKVKTTNRASARVFEKLDFQMVREEKIANERYWVYSLPKRKVS